MTKKQNPQDKYDKIPHCFKKEAGWDMFYTHLSFDQQRLVDFLCEAPDEVKDYSEDLRGIQEDIKDSIRDLENLQKKIMSDEKNHWYASASKKTQT
jgi:hypothetical protein